MIPFNKPYLTGKEVHYIYQAIYSGRISGNGVFTSKCHDFFKDHFGFNKCLLTTSCTDALEMAAILIDIQPGDEVIIPSYTFVSTANAFILRGAKIVFADCIKDIPNMDADVIEPLITSKTKAIVPVHYAGIACDMDKIMHLAEKNKLFVVEDAAQAINSFYKGRPLGSIGHFGAFSFHETKNIISGEGGLLAINDKQFTKRAEIVWEKGTNRAEFYRGEVNKYGWVDIGSSFLPSDMIAAYLFAQLENLEDIQSRRVYLWNLYLKELKTLEEQGFIKFIKYPVFSTNNAHIFSILTQNISERDHLLEYLKDNGILAIFHYLSLHKSQYFEDKHDGRELPNSDYFADCLVRLPLFYELKEEEIKFICNKIVEFFKIHSITAGF